MKVDRWVIDWVFHLADYWVDLKAGKLEALMEMQMVGPMVDPMERKSDSSLVENLVDH